MRTLALCVVLIGFSFCVVAEEAAPVSDSNGRAGTEEFLRAASDLTVSPADTAMPSGEPMPLQVRECVKMAIEKNPQALSAQDDVDAATARIRQARSAMLPKVTASIAGTLTDYNEPHRSPLSSLGSAGSSFGSFGAGGGALTGQQRLALAVGGFVVQDMLSKKMADATTPQERLVTKQLSISQVIYAGGQIQAAVRASEFLAKSQEWKRLAALDSLEFETKKAYYDAILTSALVRVSEDSVKTFERNLQDAENMFAAGMISNFEVLRARTELGTRQADAVSARNAERLAHANLLRLLALPQDTAVALAPGLEWCDSVPAKSELITFASTHRPELLALDQAIEAAKQNVKRVRGEYLPQVAASADYKTTDGGRAVVADGWTMSVGAQWDIVAGGKRRGERAEAEAQTRSLEHQRQDLEHLIDLDITQSLIQVQDAVAKVASERTNVELAKEGLRLAELRFKEGVGTQTEILQAELALTGAETKLVQAIRDYAVGQASLERATGKSWSRQAS